MLKKFVKSILDSVGIKEPSGNRSVEREEGLTNERILDELCEHFEDVLMTESVGSRMLYPMSFNILMTPEDYDDRKQALPFVVPEVVANFYNIIKAKSAKFPNFTPPATFWHFQFSACAVREVKVGEQTMKLVNKGGVTTLSSLYKLEIKDTANITVDSNVRVSMKLDQSVVGKDTNANLAAIRNLEVLGDGTYAVKFDMSLNANAKDISVLPADGLSLAILTYQKDGKNVTYSMQDQLIHISGKNDGRTGRNVFHLESETIRDSHIQIKQKSGENSFQIAAFGEARLNGSLIPVSSGGNVNWMDLPNNSSILISDGFLGIRVMFVINK